MILVTGGTGLLGSHLLYDLCLRSEKVRAIKRGDSNTDLVRKIFLHYSPDGNELFNRIEWVDGDVTDIFSLEDALQGVTKVYHCAALVSFNKRDKKKLYQVNAEGTANVVNACLDANIQKLCHVSSTAALGKKQTSEMLDETVWWKASPENSNYSISKYNAEREVWRGIEEGLNAVIVNPCVIIGPYDWNKSSAAIFKTVYQGLKYYSTGSNAFVDARDVSAAMVSLMESEIAAERFLVVSENLTFQEYFTKLAIIMGRKAPRVKVSPWLSSIGYRYEALRAWITRTSPRITKETTAAAFRNYTYSNEKIKKAIGIEFHPVNEAIENSVSFLKKEYMK